MVDAPWLTIVGLGEDGPDGLSPASRHALDTAKVVMGTTRHLTLLSDLEAKIIEWPVPFADGLSILMRFRGQRVVVLASGDPFWFGAGAVITRNLAPGEWHALPGISTFSLAAARLGWPLQHTLCIGLHAAPMTRLKPHLAPGVRAMVLLRDGGAVPILADYLAGEGFGATRLTIMEALGGPRERSTETRAETLPDRTFAHPVVVAIEVAGTGSSVTCASGIDDSFFDTDGQITKRPVRALALSALAPRPFEMLWDIGGGAGSIAIEWLLAHPTTRVISIEARPDRAVRIRTNANRLGVDRLRVVEGEVLAALNGLTPPQAVFIGGGLSHELLTDLTVRLAPGTRLIAHAVTLESETLLSTWSERLGGSLLRIELSEALPLGAKRGWRATYPVVQWRVVL
ncbi:MAG: precorrin-6y C5,15-methyltransferase (decarboxylating) subunit CbiE [Rhodobacteraceae bacterium]|nr:precorrin-6y C5,15-methyltransferase (decarboxylating) subunit CbiE [Paracoccaceae bacterium]